ncbi:MAG: DUF1800 domain-containing protein [Actinobacteria bacterium]|nr:DUF1800 domain-containing protein [Actinomycetota bacterium]
MGGPNATREEVARLFGRVAFGATAADLDAWSHQPYEAAVDHLLNVPATASRLPQGDDPERASLEQKPMDDYSPLHSMQQWWLERMRTAQYPLEERLTLLWHDHFATAARNPDVPPTLVFRQIQTLRGHALGSFRNLVTDVSTDPAMLLWLNGAESIGGKPNENYARELMELFTLGTHPQVYSETDVREAARALTGWTVDGNGNAQFVPSRHDTGTKRVLGRTINNGGATEYQQLIEAALAQATSARFIGYKLVAGLAYQPSTTDLVNNPDPLVAKVGDSLRRSNWDIKTAVRTLLLSDEFRHTNGSDGRRYVKSPAEVIVGTVKALGVTANNQPIADAMGTMGQQLLVPPNVGGWPKGRRWLSSSTLVARYGWALTAYGRWQQGPVLRPALPVPTDLNAWAGLFGLSALSGVTADALRHYVDTRKSAAPEELQAGIMCLLLTSPDWMVV